MDGSTFLASLASTSGGGGAAAKSPADVKASALIQFNSGILDSLPVQPGVKNITLIPSPSGKLHRSMHSPLSPSPSVDVLVRLHHGLLKRFAVFSLDRIHES